VERRGQRGMEGGPDGDRFLVDWLAPFPILVVPSVPHHFRLRREAFRFPTSTYREDCSSFRGSGCKLFKTQFKKFLKIRDTAAE